MTVPIRVLSMGGNSKPDFLDCLKGVKSSVVRLSIYAYKPTAIIKKLLIIRSGEEPYIVFWIANFCGSGKCIYHNIINSRVVSSSTYHRANY